jgi:tetratricopeptide (TPR) repeat protein
MSGSWLKQFREAETAVERDAMMLALTLSALSPELGKALQAAAVPHWFNAGFLDALLGEKSDKFYDELLTLSFVEQVPGLGYAIHELVRRQILQELWQKDPQHFIYLSERAAGYCAEQASLNEDAAASWGAEEIYHRLVSDPDDGIANLSALATKWANYEYHTYDEIEHAVKLAEEQIEAGRLGGVGEDWTRLWQARLALNFGRPDLVPEALDQITIEPEKDLFLAAEVAQAWGDMQAQSGNVPAAIKAWREAYERYSQPPDGSGRLDAFLVSEKIRGAGQPDPRVEKVEETPLNPPGKDALQLIDNIEYAWIEGVLDKALDQTLRLFMAHGGGLTSNLLFHQPQGIDRPVGSGRLSRLFAAAGGSMLILGAPGSGKTITLLQLLEELLHEARIDANAPIPLLFNLSSFSAYTQKNEAELTGWVADQAHKQYRLKRETTREQLAAGRDFTLLLDGLDEVPVQERGTCVEAINQFVQAYPSELVVCSRIGDYQALNTKLALNHALVLQPLSNEQIGAVIEQQSEPDQPAMQALIKSDWQLREALRSPLLLSLYPKAFRASEPSDWSENDTVEARRQSLFAAYVSSVFSYPETAGSIPSTEPVEISSNKNKKTQSEKWLAFLANKMQEAGTAIFLVEDFQPDWLPKSLIPRYRGLYGFILGLILGLITWLVNVWGVILSNGMSTGLSEGLIVSMGYVIGLPLATLITTRLNQPWQKFVSGAIVAGLSVGLIFGLLVALISGLFVGLGSVLILGVVGGLGFGFGAMISAGLASQRTKIQLRDWVKIVRPSRQKLMTGVKRGGLIGLFVGLGFGLGLGFSDLASLGLIEGPIEGLVFGLSIGLAGGLVGGASAFLDTPQVEERPYPGQGVRASLRNALLWSGITGLLFYLPSWYFDWLIQANWSLFVLVLINVIPIAFTWFGGLAWCQHIALRILFSHNNWLPHPRQLIPWLDEMAALGLLRRVGGGYIFIHRSLLEYFAALES